MLGELSREGSLPDSMSKAVIVLVPKPGKDPEDCASYCPISLINADAKLLAKVLANRLTQVLDELVHVDHTGFMPGKGTEINLRRLFLNMSTTHDNNDSRVIASLDAEKAFDSGVGLPLGGARQIWVRSSIFEMAQTTLSVSYGLYSH